MKIGEVFGTENRFLLGCWIVAVALVVVLGLFLSSDPVNILGVAESREFQVNFDSPVEIKHIYVMPSQIVKKGDLLAELGQSEWDAQLRVLKSRYDKLQAEMRLRREIAGIAQELGTTVPNGADPLLVDLEDTKREMDLIEGRLKNLFVFAEVDGAVGAVNFKSGEKAPSFAPLITLLPLNPTYVNGYVNENLNSSLSVGQAVEVVSSGGKSIRGQVLSVGSRIVPIPERLLRIQTLSAWGREVVIKIPPTNGFLLGEKVSVHKRWGLSFVNFAQADEVVADSVSELPQDLELPEEVLTQFHPEMSGMVFIPELRQFVLVSDDYPEDRPVLFLMNEQGQVQSHQISITGLDQMQDIESVSLAGDRLYLLGSLSRTKKGKLKPDRHLFAKVRRNGLRYHLEQTVELREKILQALSQSKEEVLRRLAGLDQQNPKAGFEVEGHAVDGENLYLALKGPALALNKGLILKVDDFQNLFEDRPLSADRVHVAAEFEMTLPHIKVESVVTDLVKLGENFYVSSSCRKASCSAVWKVKAGQGKAELVRDFSYSHLEALALHPDSKKLFAVFEAKSGGRFVVLPTAEKRTP
ncbi:DUF3616 domain-containing protein [Bdellovibrio bacteriovorus]|uniref:DUF3616 domain-containing protein n=1 Tax=Bdellovibrio bacteriovorus TaxID=959 RepID=UPI0021CF94AA|nr:DUF3616 domain-containing protein [Bdellovibrio bacteriovorus]UXR64680.1 DUF3616 domain-containing protein [Bdellovibrio bacteriovorus]